MSNFYNTKDANKLIFGIKNIKVKQDQTLNKSINISNFKHYEKAN
jgi:hypothetical protein